MHRPPRTMAVRKNLRIKLEYVHRVSGPSEASDAKARGTKTRFVIGKSRLAQPSPRRAMNARASTSNPPKFTRPFVPPSDSPRSQSFVSPPIRSSRDGVPPAKRRRLASTPTSSSLSLSTPRSSSRPEQPTLPDLHDARAASSMRVLNIWSALAERYNRRIDEDDIVDIRTGEVVKDRGVLSELPKRYNFGDLADKDDDPTINTDPCSEAADNLAEDEEDDDDEDEDGAEDAFPTSDGLVSSRITRLAPLRPTTSSSDADDLRSFLEAEAIRRELDGGDESSEDEFNILPPRPTPAKRTMTPAKKTPLTARVGRRPLQTPAPDTDSEDEFAVRYSDRDDVHRGYRARRTPSPEIPASMPSPPPPSSSPGPSSSFSLPSSPMLSRTPLSSHYGPQTEEPFGSPTHRRRPLTLASRKTLEDTLNEIDLEFPPPQPRAPSVFVGRAGSAFIIDLSLSDAETEDERSCPPSKVATDPKPATPEPKLMRKGSSTLLSRLPIPFVLIETKPPAPVTPASTIVASEIASAPIDPDPGTPSQPGVRRSTTTLQNQGKRRGRPSKHEPPDLPKRGGGSKARPVRSGSQEEGGDALAGSSTSLRVDERPVKRGTTEKVKLRSLSPARSDSCPKAKTKPGPNPKGKKSFTRRTLPDGEHGSGSEPSPTKRVRSPVSSPRPQTPATTPVPDLKSKPTHKSITKPKSTRSESKTQRKPPEISTDAESDDYGSPPSPPPPFPAPPIRRRPRSALKRKRIVSSGPSSEGEHSSRPSGSRTQACTIATSEVIDAEKVDHHGGPEAGLLSRFGFFLWETEPMDNDRWIQTSDTIASSF